MSSLQSLLDTYSSRLSTRERRLLQTAFLVFLGILGYVWVLAPLWEAQADFRTRIVAREKKLKEVQALSQTYRALKAELQTEARPQGQGDFSLFSYLEGLATSTVGRKKISAMNPLPPGLGREGQGEAVELRLSGVSLRELVELLYKLERTSPRLHTSRLQVKKRYKDPYMFDATLLTSVLGRAEEAPYP